MFIFVFFTILSLSNNQKGLKQNVFTKSSILKRVKQSLNYSDFGFYSVSISNGDAIEFSLDHGKQSIFFLMPYDPNFYIQDIIIDGIFVSHSAHPSGLAIEGNDSVILTFKTAVLGLQIQSNFWIIPSDLCQCPSSYVYGKQIVNTHIINSQLCVFSPIFDSKNQKFKIESGIPFDSLDHYTSFYTVNYQKPDFINYDNIIESHEFTTGNFVKFSSSDLTLNSPKPNDIEDTETLFYKRQTKIKSSSHSENICVVEPFLRCNSNGCISDTINIDFKKCSESGPNVVVITVACVGSVLFIALLCLILCCLSRRNKKQDSMNTVLINNEEVGANDYTKSQT
ncbi:hypothetical protein M9Y10_024615 [Tritrichomonas musculus]|uniref:Uncharacterized protein n=1 Tax=Tritrichomonas musculus TaxID=1915356 RepID=A0ABR2HD43_9EUKA